MVIGIGPHEHDRVGVASRPPRRQAECRSRGTGSSSGWRWSIRPARQLPLCGSRQSRVRRLDAVRTRSSRRGSRPRARGGRRMQPMPTQRGASAGRGGGGPRRRVRRRPSSPSRSGARGRELGPRASTAVDAVRLLFGGHAAGYGSHRPCLPLAPSVSTSEARRSSRGSSSRDGTHRPPSSVATPGRVAEAFLRGLAEVVDALRDDTLSVVGVGIPSTIDQRDGLVGLLGARAIAGVPLRARGEEYLGLPVAIDNDANAAAVAEWTIGAGTGTDRHGHAHARHRHRRRAHPRRRLLSRLDRCRGRARPPGDRVRRPAVSWLLHRSWALRAVRVR